MPYQKSEIKYQQLNVGDKVPDAPDLFLSRRSQRYMMMVRDNVVFRLSVEPNLVDLTCTSGEAALAAS